MLLLILVLIVENSIMSMYLLLILFIKEYLIVYMQKLLVSSLRLTLSEISAFELVIVVSRRLGGLWLLAQFMKS